MNRLKLKIFVFVTLTYFLATVNADCTIQVQKEKPKFTQNFGKRTVLLPIYDGDINLKAGESINAHCSNGMLIEDYNSYRFDGSKDILNIEIECSMQNELFLTNLDSPDTLRPFRNRQWISISCIESTRQLFESNKALPSCEHYTSFGIGTIWNTEQMVDAGICFDFDTLKTKYVKYLAYHPINELIQLNEFHAKHETNKSDPSETYITDLDTPVRILEVLFKDLRPPFFDLSFSNEKSKNPLLSSQEFQFLNLVQDTQIAANVINFDYLLNIVWWRNFRLGNWKLFLDALEKRSENFKYIIYTGTSGNRTIPSMHNCNKTEIFKINGPPGVSFDVPDIVWAYVKPVNANQHDEFVVFGYNTPFHSTDNETIVCKDICHKIDWLYNDYFKAVHLLPAFGVVHCCRPQDVGTQLETFPVDDIALKPATTELPYIIEKLSNEN